MKFEFVVWAKVSDFQIFAEFLWFPLKLVLGTGNGLLLFGKRVGNWKLLAVAEVSNKMYTSAEGMSIEYIHIFITYECNSK